MTPPPTAMSTEAATLCIATLRNGQALTLVNLSPSMSPFVRVGDALTIDPAVPARLGVLVAVERAGRVVVHRLVAFDGERLVLRGDANPHCDTPDDSGAVLGVVTRQRLRSGRTLDHGRWWMRLVGRLLRLRTLRGTGMKPSPLPEQ